MKNAHQLKDKISLSIHSQLNAFSAKNKFMETNYFINTWCILVWQQNTAKVKAIIILKILMIFLTIFAHQINLKFMTWWLMIAKTSF